MGEGRLGGQTCKQIIACDATHASTGLCRASRDCCRCGRFRLEGSKQKRQTEFLKRAEFLEIECCYGLCPMFKEHYKVDTLASLEFCQEIEPGCCLMASSMVFGK